MMSELYPSNDDTRLVLQALDRIADKMDAILAALGEIHEGLAGGRPEWPEPGPGPRPVPEPPSSLYAFSVDEDGHGWQMQGVVNNWNQPFLLPPLVVPNTRLTSAQIELALEIGPSGMGSTFFELYRDKKRWKGDTILLLNYGGNGRIAASHTLLGAESTPVRAPIRFAPGDVVRVAATYESASGWSVSVYRGDVAARVLLAVSAPLAVLEPQALAARVLLADAGATDGVQINHQLGIQLGSHGDDNHETNAGCKLINFRARFA